MFDQLITLFKDNQFLLAGLGLGGAGLITFWIRDVPLKIFSLIKRQVTTDLIIHNYDKVFYDILVWIKEKNKKKKFRTYKLNNGKWGENETIISMGYGHHMCFYRKNLLLINYTKESESISDKIKETITITKFGRNKNLFDKILKESATKIDNNNLKLYRMDNAWYFCKKFLKRSLNTIFIKKQQKDFLFSNIKKFIKKEEWYLKHGIPYQYGVLLHGNPGSGKTSLIKAIATELSYNIYYLSPNKLSEIENALTTCPEKCVVVIEDIDSNTVVHKRDKPKDNDTELLQSLLQNSLSDILNSLDGLNNVHGRFLICTTNHFESLDKALIRPGRFDLIVKIDYVNNEIFKQFLDFYFPDKKINCKNMKLRKNITVADLQNMVLLGFDYKLIIKKSLKNYNRQVSKKVRVQKFE